MWFPVRGALLLSVFFAALGSASLRLSAQAVAAASAETSAEASPEIRRGASGIGIADPKFDARIESLLHGMTLEEKIGQLVQYSAGQATGPGTGRTDYKDMIARGQIGALLNVIDTPLLNEYQHIAVEKSRLHIPLLFRARRDSWIPDGVSDSFGNGFHMGSGIGREGVSCGGLGSFRHRHSVDVFSDGGHRARCALGADGGRRG